MGNNIQWLGYTVDSNCLCCFCSDFFLAQMFTFEIEEPKKVGFILTITFKLFEKCYLHKH